MKKFWALALAGILTLSLAACGTPTEATGTGDESKETESPAAQPLSDVDISGEIGGEINISCFDTMIHKGFLEEAAKAFEEKYPGTKVNITGFSKMPEPKTIENDDGTSMVVMMAEEPDPSSKNDYVNQISTALMSGQGPDILAMDILPYYKYAESGQLDDLKAYMSADKEFNPSDYRQNILDNVQYNGGQYFIPMDYTYDYLNYDTTLLSPEAQEALKQAGSLTYDKLVSIAQASFEAQSGNPDSSKLFNLLDGIKSMPSLFQALLDESYNQFLDFENKKVNFNDGQFAALLEKAREYSGKGYVDKALTPEDMENNMNTMMESFSAGAGITPAMFPRYFYQNTSVMALLQQFEDPEDNTMRSFNSSMGNMEDSEIAGLMQDSQGNVPFSFYQAYGINAHSQNKATAWAFIKFLLSEEMQTSMNIFGRPVNCKADAEKAKLEVSGQLFRPDANQGSDTLTEKQQAAYDAYHATLEQFAGQLNAFNIKDGIIEDMIATEVSYFFDGTKTAEQVADALQSRVELYMNE